MIEYGRRAAESVGSTQIHCAQFTSQHAEPWKAVRSKDEGASCTLDRSKLIEERVIKNLADRITDTVNEKRGSWD